MSGLATQDYRGMLDRSVIAGSFTLRVKGISHLVEKRTERTEMFPSVPGNLRAPAENGEERKEKEREREKEREPAEGSCCEEEQLREKDKTA